ncbi:DNase I-like protein [Saccharata proteae CBS 121410]|uniref:DNase I-like protein n=1 Tax=Saccharata proteae CBS 121410 TaxID=1314787 RepID=A0A9P4LWW6_9PEZI|nr:DNase I-like protein [Saccharata proteae CBS 121410]
MPSSTASTTSLDQQIPGAFPATAPVSSSTPQSLFQAVHARRAEYVRPREIKIKVGTWNVAAFKGTDKDVGGWFVDGKGVEEALAGLAVSDPNELHNEPLEESGEEAREGVDEQEARRTKKESTLPENDNASIPGGEDIGLYALGLQEVVDINSATEALRPFTDPATAGKFKSALEEALPPGYKLVAEQQLIGLLLLIYASPSVAPEVRSVSTTSVGTGLMGYMGNKGAVTARIVLGETTRIAFINSHLAAGADNTSLERRNWDAAQIINRTKFDPIVDAMGVSQASGETLGEEDFAFWFGDLNYRLEGMPGEDVRRLLMLHTRDQYDLAQPSAADDESSFSDIKSQTSNNTHQEERIPAKFDPTSLQATLDSLLPHDELHQQIKKRKAFYDGWREGPIEFLPTYKYDVGTNGVFDSSEKRRCPSWCDRILYRTRQDKLAYEAKVQEEQEAKKRDEEMKKQGLDNGADEDVLFDYDPTTDGDDYDEFADDGGELQSVVTKEGFEDEIQLEYYTAHQRVLSSDHKPLDAVFRLKYDSVVPELKAKVHQEVARDLDRAENEGRPGITLIVDKDNGKRVDRDDDGSNFEGVNFGSTRYLESKRRNVTVANTGQVAATISFMIQSGTTQGGITQLTPWLSARFDRAPDAQPTEDGQPAYTLEPGDACTIELILKVSDMDLVRGLNDQTKQLDDILILRVSSGRDHFLPVRAEWLDTSFGRSIDKLIRIPEGGIRRLQGQKPTGDGSTSPTASMKDVGVKWSAPRELFRLTESAEDLVERVIAEWGMTEHEDGAAAPWDTPGGWPFAEQTWTLKDAAARDKIKSALIDAIDSDQPIDTAFEAETSSLVRLECLAEVLILFLKSLTDGVITAELWDKINTGYESQAKTRLQLAREEECAWILEGLAAVPGNHNVCFVLLTSMLARMANEIKGGLKTDATKSKSPTSPLAKRLTGTFTGRTRSVSEVQRAQKVEKELSAVMAEAMIKVPDMGAAKEKDKLFRRQRMNRVVEIFVGDGAV